MGVCYKKLGLSMEVLRSYEKAFSGNETLLGRKHYDTLQNQTKMIVINSEMVQYTEVLKLSDKVCMEQEFVPELSLAKNLINHRLRRFAYCIMDDHDRKAHI